MLSLVRRGAVLGATHCVPVETSATSLRWSKNGSPACKSPLALSPGQVMTALRQSRASSTDLRLKPRRLSLTTYASLPPAAIEAVASKDELREFKSIFPDLVRDLLTESTRNQDDLSEFSKWYSKVLTYNVRGGKCNRAMALVYSYRMLAKEGQLTEENIKLSMILGWCVELLQAFFLVTDDIMDQSETRRGKPCWYKENNIGLAAFNDGILLESGVFLLLRKHFRDQPYYVDLIEVFLDVLHKTSMGQSLDLLTSHNGKHDLNSFSVDRYSAIVKYKTAYYSFYLPVACAMYMAGIKDSEAHRQARLILLEMGNLFQVQDDFLDCFGDPSVTGKIGTDIQEGKCSWLAVRALLKANPEQRKIMEECYGSSDPEKVERVKLLYEDLNLPSIYGKDEEDNYERIQTHIQQVSRVPVDLFLKFLDKIYKRQS